MYMTTIIPKYLTNKIILLSNPDKILISSIILETCSTALLKKTIKNKLWLFPVYSGYATSFYLFPKSLEKYSLSSAYCIWCVGGIILTTIMDRILYQQIITKRNIISIIIMIFGIIIQK